MKKALLIIDYQNDFISGSLGFPEAERLAIGIRDKILQYRKEGWRILFTVDTHDASYLKTKEGQNLPIEHCIKGTDGHALHPLVKAVQKEDDLVFEKPTFGSMELAKYLEREAFEEIEIVGLVTNICVLSNAVLAKAACPEARIRVNKALCDSYDRTLHEDTLRVLSGIHIDVIE